MATTGAPTWKILLWEQPTLTASHWVKVGLKDLVMVQGPHMGLIGDHNHVFEDPRVLAFSFKKKKQKNYGFLEQIV